MRKVFIILLKLILSVVLIYAIYDTVNASVLKTDITRLKSIDFCDNIYILLAALLLMPINLMLESYKWHYTLKVQGVIISFKKSLLSIFMGASMSLITPFKVGDYLGRMFMIRSEDKAASLFSTLICSLSQNLINITLGVLGMSILMTQHFFVDGPSYIFPLSIISFCVVLIFLLYIEIILKYLLRFKWVRKRLSNFFFKKISLKDKSYVVLLSVFRYSVYMYQYILLLKVFNVYLDITSFFSGVSSIFLLQSCLPLPPFLNFLARSEIAMLIWNLYQVDVVIALWASIALWVINIALPALIGMIIGVRFVN